MSDINKCCICGKEVNDPNTYTSTLTGEPRFYCPSCLKAGFEPYKDFLEFGWEFEMFNKTYQQRILIPTLRRNNKTIEQFNTDIKKYVKETN